MKVTDRLLYVLENLFLNYLFQHKLVNIGEGGYEHETYSIQELGLSYHDKT